MAVAWPGNLLSGLAAKSSLPVFVVEGRDGHARSHRFFSQGNAHPTKSPRHAQALLVVGHVPENLHEAIARLHDQMPHPRISVWWGTPMPSALASAAIEVSDEGSVPMPADLAARVFAADYVSEVDLQKDEPPAPWRGLGDYGQGGEGMMGGKPYGRPMAMTGDDIRDGLQLDQHTIRIGPFFPNLPPGFGMEVDLQGDVIQDINQVHPPFPLDATLLEPFRAAHSKPVPIPRLERLRATSHLEHIARYLRFCDLNSVAARFDGAATQLYAGKTPTLKTLHQLLLSSAALRATEPGFGRLDRVLLDRISGPARRAGGDPEDLRSQEPTYRNLDFVIVQQEEGDLRARLRQWMLEAEAALQLALDAERASTYFRATAHAVEGPAGPVPPQTAATENDGFIEPSPAFKQTLLGMEWHEALLFIASFDVQALRCLLLEEDQ